MNRNLLTYKGYSAKIEFDADDGVFYGDVIDVDDTITFTGGSVDELIEGFHSAIDSYLQFCEEVGRSPEKPYSGRVQLRLPKSLHKLAAVQAAAYDSSLNDLFVEAITVYLSSSSESSSRQHVLP